MADIACLKTAKLKTLLIYPPDTLSFDRYSCAGIPCGLAYLKGFIQEKGYAHARLLHFYRKKRSVAHLTRTALAALVRNADVTNRICAIAGALRPVGTQVIASVVTGIDTLRDYRPRRLELFTLSEGLRLGLGGQVDRRSPLYRRLSGLIKKGGYGLAGISVETYPQLPFALEIARDIKLADPAVFIVLGGPVVTQNIETFIRNAGMHEIIDGFVIKRGEESLARLIDLLDRKADGFEDVPNFYYKTREGYSASRRTAVNLPEHLKTIPDFGDCGLEYLPAAFSRGCYWSKCTFCYNPLIDATCMVKPEEAVSLVKQLQRKYRISTFELLDNALPPEFIEEFCRRLIEENVRVTWNTKVNIEKAFYSGSLPKLMKEAGCGMVMLGIESVSQRILERMAKMQRAEETLPMAMALKDAGIRVGALLIFGFPGETSQEALETIQFIKKNRALFDVIVASPFTLQEGTGVYTSRAAFGITRIEKTDKNGVNYGGYNYEVSEGLTQEEAEMYAAYAQSLQRWSG